MNWIKIESVDDLPDESERMIIWVQNPFFGGMWMDVIWLPESREFERGEDRYPVEFVSAYFIPESYE